MAPRKKPQTPSDETTQDAKDETVTAASADDTVAADPAPETVTDAEDSLADTPASEMADEDAIALSEPDSEKAPDADVADAPSDQDVTEETADTAEPDLTTEADAPAEAQSVAETEARWSEFAAIPPEDRTEKRGLGVLMMILAGVVVAALGYFAAALSMNTDTDSITARLAAQDDAIAEVRSAIPEAVDTVAIDTAVAENTDALNELSARLDTLSADVAAMTERMTELERAPMENAVSDAAMKAYEDELARLQNAMRAQREEVEAMVSDAQALQASASAQTARTEARAALTAILSAFNSGTSYSEPLSRLRATGQQIPAALAENEGGIPTLADLRADFPAAARDALAVTRGAGNESVSGFFKTQLGIRSLEPKEGDDPDAILSRAEAAVADGNIAKALEELSALPPEAQAELTDWTAAAQTRLTTVEAANGLMAELNSN